MEFLVSKEHISEEVALLLCIHLLHVHVKVSKSSSSVFHICVRSRNIERTDKSAVIHQHDFFMVPLEEVPVLKSQPVSPLLHRRIVNYYQTTSCFTFSLEVFSCPVIKAVDYNVHFYSSSSRSCAFLESYSCSNFMIDIVVSNHDAVFGSVNSIPKEVHKLIIIFVKLYFLAQSSFFYFSFFFFYVFLVQIIYCLVYFRFGEVFFPRSDVKLLKSFF